MANYRYSVQYGTSEIDEVEDRGVASSSEIEAAFHAFDWPGEVKNANRIERCSPTFSVQDVDSGRELWVSAHGDPTSFIFVSHYSYIKRVKKWFGLSEGDAHRSPNCRQDLSLGEASEAVRFFLAERHEELLALVSAA